MLLAASTQRSIGLVILAIVFIGGAVYLFFNIRAAKAEVGSEIELAANRSAPLSDETLEGTRLDFALFANLAMLAIIAFALPFYWLGEPGRHEGRDVDTARIFTNRGENIYLNGAQCVNCHGGNGTGGAVSTAITDDNGGFVAQVVWKAPALNTVLSRFSEDEIMHTLNYGRNGVMPAWGAPGGGPLTEQQLQEVIYYLRSIQIDEATIRAEVDAGVMQRVEEYVVNGTDDSGAHVFDDETLTALREAEAAQLEADLAVEGPDLKCGSADLDSEAQALCDAQAEAATAVTEARAAAADTISKMATDWLARAQGVAQVAADMALADDPSLADGVSIDSATGKEVNLPLRWAALERLSDPNSDVPDVELYRKYGEFLFTNPAASGTFSCARCHTYGWSFDAAERFTVRANGTTESILPDGYVQGDGWFGPALTRSSTTNQFETARSHAQFIEKGQTIGQTFGRSGSGGNGQMPGWAARTETDAVGPTIGNDDEFDYPALLTAEQIDAIVAYERTLP